MYVCVYVCMNVCMHVCNETFTITVFVPFQFSLYFSKISEFESLAIRDLRQVHSRVKLDCITTYSHPLNTGAIDF